MRHLLKFVFLMMSFVFCNSAVLANITYLRFYSSQVYDAQRSPGFPVANNPFTLSGFHHPYRSNLSPYTLSNDEYIQLFFVGGYCQDGKVGINRYNANGVLLETVQPTGHVYGLGPEGFLHDSDNNIGTFISARPLSGDSLTYIPMTGPAPETCASLEVYIHNNY